MRPYATFPLNLLAPAPIATAIISLVVAIESRSPEFLIAAPGMLVFAYLFAGIPSLVHALFLEWFYRRGNPPHGKRALVASTLSGFVAGLAITVFITGGSIRFDDLGALLFLPVGAATGAFNALLHRIRRQAKPENHAGC